MGLVISRYVRERHGNLIEIDVMEFVHSPYEGGWKVLVYSAVHNSQRAQSVSGHASCGATLSAVKSHWRVAAFEILSDVRKKEDTAARWLRARG